MKIQVMPEGDVIYEEFNNSGTSKTKNDQFEKNGYITVENLWDSDDLFITLPKERGCMSWYTDDSSEYEHRGVEEQVEGSLSRYNHPKYKKIHSQVRLKLEKILGVKLYNTYYFDRFYLPGLELTRHTDRPSCEISVSVHISSNLKEPWPFWIKTPDIYKDKENGVLESKGENHSVILGAGDGIIYKGCERPHWRDRMPGTLEMSLGLAKNPNMEQLYFHQIFFHYVLQDGIRAHEAFDRTFRS